MCGIAGILDLRGDGICRDELLVIRDEMRPRGPDGADAWFAPDGRIGMAHRRLSIIDLSESGSQPMSWGNGRYQIVFNGEIYNYRELRRELERKGVCFRSTSDTEVLLALYDLQGEQMLEFLRGMYAFALWDTQAQILFLARDPFGIKPLYYRDDGGLFRWASQVKPLVAVAPTTPDPAGHVGLFLLGSVPEPHTLYREIRALPAGFSLRVDKTGQHLNRYCDLTAILKKPVEDACDFDYNEAVDELAAAMRSSVRAHLVSDVPVGIFLSAGLDSTAIAVMAAEQGASQLRTLTLGFNEYRGTDDDETVLARRVANTIGSQHSECWISQHDFYQDIETIIAAMDQPTIDGINSYFVSKAAASNGLKVALSGLGADELFGSYPSFRDIPQLVRLAGPLSRIPGLGRVARQFIGPLIGAISSPKYAGVLEYGGDYGGAYLLRRGLFMPWELSEVLGEEMARDGLLELDLLQRFKESLGNLQEPRTLVSALELQWYMRNQLLRDADWAGMAHSVEIRVPFVDLELFRAVAKLLPAIGQVSKSYIMRQCAKSLPDVVLDRPKTGFSVPIRRWLGDHGKGNGCGRGLRGWMRMVYERGGWAL